MSHDNSKYSTFISSYNDGISPYLNTISASFFDRIAVDKDNIIDKSASTPILLEKIKHLKIEEGTDKFESLKKAGYTLLDIAPYIIENQDDTIKKSGINIINNFFDVARQTENEDLLKTAATISSLKERI